MTATSGASVDYVGSLERQKFPNLNLRRRLFQLKKFGKSKYPEHLNYLHENVIKYNMAPFYRTYCEELGLEVDEQFVQPLEEENKKVLKSLDEAIKKAEAEEGDLELRDAIIEKAEYMAVIGSDLSQVTDTLETALKNKSCSVGIKFRILFMMMKASIFHNSRLGFKRWIKKAKEIGDHHVDWEARNKFKLYLGLYSLWNRDYATACTLFHQIMTTFSLTDVVSFHDLGIYTVIISVICLPRNKLKKSVIDAPEIQEATFNDNHIRRIPNHLYQCSYDKFFMEIAHVVDFAEQDMFLCEHSMNLDDELRIKAYQQLLCSFKSLKIEFLSEAIGRSIDHVDTELSRFICDGRLACKIDKVRGLVYNSSVQKKDHQLEKIFAEGDQLLAKIDFIIKHVS